MIRVFEPDVPIAVLLGALQTVRIILRPEGAR